MDTFDRLVAGIIAALVVAIGIVIALGDRVGVIVTLTTPGDRQSSSSTAPISLTFSQPMDTAGVEDRFSIEPAVEGTMRWEGNMLIFRPDQPLTPQRTYTVTVEAGAQSLLERRVIRPQTWSLTPRLPRVIYLAPADADARSLWVAESDGSQPRRIYAPEHGLYDFAPSPDGEQIAVTVYEADQSADIWLIDAAGANPRRITDCQGGFCASPAWSPDGRQIAFDHQGPSTTGSGGSSRVWLVDPATGQSAPLFQDDQVLGFDPVWSPDGNRLAFFDGNSQAIRVIDLSNGDTFRLPSMMGEAGSFSPDGAQLAYADIKQVGRQFYPDIMLAHLGIDGGLEPLLDQAEENQAPTWSPDGKWIAFGHRLLNREQGFGFQLMLIDPAGRWIQQITDDPGYNNSLFAWSPGSDRILLHRFDLQSAPDTLELWVYGLDDGSLTRLVDNAFGGQWLP
ncbi:MAG: PD40 domain-containing protein [Anaerolineae bacterium]|nr:PD40 domain-containing protein [Anaerolineae bacterium]